MKKNVRIILSIIALAFMLIFTVMTVIALYDSDAMGGAALYAGIGAGLVAFGIYVVIMRDNRIRDEREMLSKIEAEMTEENFEEDVDAQSKGEDATLEDGIAKKQEDLDTGK